MGAAASSIPTVTAWAAEEGDDTSTIPPLKIGLMTYLLGKEWDIETIIRNCTEAKFEHVELRTTHAHGVEVSLSPQERAGVRQRFEDAGLKLSLASGFAYHHSDPAKQKENIEGTKEYTLLARDLGAIGIRVFPNALSNEAGESEEQIIERIGHAAAEVATFGADHGVEIRLANHGRGTNRISVVKRILDAANCPHLFVNWNCDRSDMASPGLEAHFHLVKDRIRNIHLHDLTDDYPYRQLFALLRASGYDGYCDAEVSASLEPVRFMKYYRALFLALQNAV